MQVKYRFRVVTTTYYTNRRWFRMCPGANVELQVGLLQAGWLSVVQWAGPVRQPAVDAVLCVLYQGDIHVCHARGWHVSILSLFGRLQAKHSVKKGGPTELNIYTGSCDPTLGG